MRQPRFRKRLEKGRVAKQILTEQIVGLLHGDWPPLFASLREKTVRACMRESSAPRRFLAIFAETRTAANLQIEPTYLRSHKCSSKRSRDS